MIRFYKLSGGGNDFLALAEPASEPPAERIAAWCARGLSLGADGLFLLRRSGGGARMAHFNADGGRAELCLNGTRCAARLAFYLGWAAERIEIETDAGPVTAREAGGDRVGLELEAPSAEAPRRTVEALGGPHRGWPVLAGVPHFVLEWPASLAAAPVDTLGAALRSHPDLGAAGANVDFVRFTGRRRFEIRTFERGVEGETLACGTGVLAAAAAGVAAGRLELPAVALTRGGFELEVAEVSAAAGDRPRWTLSGDARLLCHGDLTDAAGHIPPGPRWAP